MINVKDLLSFLNPDTFVVIVEDDKIQIAAYATSLSLSTYHTKGVNKVIPDHITINHSFLVCLIIDILPFSV